MTPWEKSTVARPDHEIHRARLKKVHQSLKSEIDFVIEQTKFKEFAAPEMAAIVLLLARCLMELLKNKMRSSDFIEITQFAQERVALGLAAWILINFLLQSPTSS